MTLNSTHAAFVVTGLALAVLLMMGSPTSQVDKVAIHKQPATPRPETPFGFSTQTTPQAPESVQPCETVSPFAVASVACRQTELSPQTDSAQGGGAAGNGTSTMASLPDFVKVEVVGSLGEGIAASLLKAAQRDLAGTSDNHDAMLIDSSAMPEATVATTIQ